MAVLNRFDEGSEVTPVDLLQGLIRINGGGVKILGNGNLEKKLTVRADAFSESARARSRLPAVRQPSMINEE